MMAGYKAVILDEKEGGRRDVPSIAAAPGRARIRMRSLGLFCRVACSKLRMSKICQPRTGGKVRADAGRAVAELRACEEKLAQSANSNE